MYFKIQDLPITRCVINVVQTDLHIHVLREVADKSLARPTSRCRRTESIVSFEREVCSCAALQAISCYRG